MMFRVNKTFVAVAATLLIHQNLLAAPDLSGVWMLDGRVAEGELLMTDKALEIQAAYDLLEDDPSLACVPASTSRVWANPNVHIAFEQNESQVVIKYEFYDLRRTIPLGDVSGIGEVPSTRNLDGAVFAEMGSSVARYEGERLIIDTQQHAPGYIRTSRGIPQSQMTTSREEIWREGDVLHLILTYYDDSLFQKPFVLTHQFEKVGDGDIPVYDCTDAGYDWFEQLNAPQAPPQS